MSQPAAISRSRQAAIAASAAVFVAGSKKLLVGSTLPNASTSLQVSAGSAWYVPRWSMKIASRSAFIPFCTHCTAVRIEVPPGPPLR